MAWHNMALHPMGSMRRSCISWTNCELSAIRGFRRVATGFERLPPKRTERMISRGSGGGHHGYAADSPGTDWEPTEITVKYKFMHKPCNLEWVTTQKLAVTVANLTVEFGRGKPLLNPSTGNGRPRNSEQPRNENHMNLKTTRIGTSVPLGALPRSGHPPSGIPIRHLHTAAIAGQYPMGH